MLVRDEWESPFPDNDLTYLGFLAETWARHRCDEVHTASLLDAAVLYAASEAAAVYVSMGRGWIRTALRQGARQPDLRLDRWTARHIRLQLGRWWPGLEFGGWEATAELSEYPEAEVRPLAEALGRLAVSPALASNLKGLLAEEVIRQALPLLGG